MARQRPVEGKPVVFRRAIATGELALGPASRAAIRTGRVEKGDPIAAGELAGLLAVKATPALLPHCHLVPVTGSEVVIRPVRGGVRARATVEAYYRTGVEMEALVAVSVALLTVWDMVKYLEKDAGGGYPRTRIQAIRVVAKEKRAPE